MKHLSLCLTVVVLVGLPLAAAAFDYGPNGSLLAGETSTPQLPGAQVRAPAAGDIPAPYALESSTDEAGGGADPAARARRHAAPPAPPGPAPTRGDPSAARHPAHQPPSSAKPGSGPRQAAWQSLLPGSIQ